MTAGKDGSYQTKPAAKWIEAYHQFQCEQREKRRIAQRKQVTASAHVPLSRTQMEAAGLQVDVRVRMEPPCARFKAHRRRLAALGGILDAKRYSEQKTAFQGSGRSRAVKQSFRR